MHTIKWLAALTYLTMIGTAFAQDNVQISTPSGCVLLISSFTAKQLKGSTDYKGACSNGLAHGQGYALLDFGSEQALLLSQWDRGHRTGASVTLYRRQPGRLAFADYRQGTQGVATTSDQGWNAALINDTIRDMFQRIGAQASLSEAVVIETAMRWNKLPRQTKPADVFAQIDISALQPSNPAVATEAMADDPKSRGRSAKTIQ